MEFLSQGRRSDILLNKIEALLIFDPLITLWGHFKTSYFKMLNDARVASACLYVRTCQRVRNSKNIATIRDFQLHVRVNSTIYIPPCDIVLVLVGRAIINILINNHISPTCQLPDTYAKYRTLYIASYQTSHTKTYTSVFKTYFNAVNLPISYILSQ